MAASLQVNLWHGMPVSLPQVIAHRGANDAEPEHSLAAYLRAIEQGVSGVECDVRLTMDGTLVCVHDRRINRTSSGRGSVSGQYLSELVISDFSGRIDDWMDFEDPRPDESRTRLLTLETLLTTVLDASQTIEFAIETKHPVRFGKYVEMELFDVLKRYGLANSSRVRVMSFSRRAIQRYRTYSPETNVVFLLERVPRAYRDGTLPTGVAISGISIDYIRERPEYVELVHNKGGKVHVWTVDNMSDVDLCVNLGVDAIISNRPGEVLAQLRKHLTPGIGLPTN
jgi:glycerophosphoryl diester phosphodiesterase